MAALVLAVLLPLFVGSVYDSIRANGFLGGVITKRAAQPVLGCLGMLVIVVAGSVAIEKLWGKYAAMWGLGAISIAVVFGPVLLQRLRGRADSFESNKEK